MKYRLAYFPKLVTAKGFNTFEVKGTQTIKPSLFKGLDYFEEQIMQPLKRHLFMEGLKTRNILIYGDSMAEYL